MFDLVIRNATVLQPDGTTAEGDVACRKGKIEQITPTFGANAQETIDARGRLLLPGVIDPQVHFREPGDTHKENLSSGSRAAVRGGVTSYLEMPNCKPPTTSQVHLDWKLARAAKSSVANFGFFIGASRDNLAALNTTHPACGIKIFMGSSTGDLLVDDEDLLDTIFATGDRLIAVHAEDETRIRERTSLFLRDESGQKSYEIHSQIRDSETALIATQRAIRLSKKYSRRLHILHLSTAEEVDFLRLEKPPQVSCEVVPNHLFLSSDDYHKLGSRVQMNPPVRVPENTPALWQGLQDGVIDIIATDHAPHTAEEKSQPYPLSPSGAPGVETSLPLMLTEMASGKCTLQQIQEWMCHGPARLYGIPDKGLIAEGFDADLTLVDLERYRSVVNEEIFSRSGWSPYSDRQLTGWPVYTVVNGLVVFDHGKIRSGIYGQSLKFTEATDYR
jgi:dihydroorotase